jgi:biopolymer transport protein ExbD
MNHDERNSGGMLTTIVVGLLCLIVSLGGGMGFFMYRQQQKELLAMRADLAIQQEMLAANQARPEEATDMSELLELVPKQPADGSAAQIVEVRIDAAGKLTVEGETLTADELRTLLAVDRLERAISVKITADAKTPLPSYLAAVHACDDAGVPEITAVEGATP